MIWAISKTEGNDPVNMEQVVTFGKGIAEWQNGEPAIIFKYPGGKVVWKYAEEKTRDRVFESMKDWYKGDGCK